MKYKESQTKFSKETFYAQVILLAVIAGFLSILKLSVNTVHNSTQGLATLAINFEKKRAFEGNVVKDMSILDALNAAVLAGQIKLNYVVNSRGDVTVNEINGHMSGSENKHFTFYLNSKAIVVKDLARQKIEPGDRIEIVFK